MLTKEEREGIFHNFWQLEDVTKQRQFLLFRIIQKEKYDANQQIES